MPFVLNEAQADLLRDEKSYLTKLHSTLTEIKSPDDDLAKLRDSIVQLDELFLIVVVGEFNAGKSALVNALLGAKMLAEGVTPTTTRVTLVKYGDTTRETTTPEGIAVVYYPLDFLKELNIVDTPGTNAVIRQHEELTRDFIPRSDLVLFVTSADRPFTESERQFLEHIREWGKKIVFVINKGDILENEASQLEVKEFVQKNARSQLGFVPELFLVSAKQESENGNLIGGMSTLKAYVLSWLDEKARVHVKFANPLGVADQVLKRAETRSQQERESLKIDIETSDNVEREVNSFEQEIKQELEPRLAEVDNLLFKLEARGMDFFDQHIRLTKITELARGDKFRAMFEQQVLSGVPQEIENRTRAVVDWLVEKDLREWQQILSYLTRRRAVTADQLVGEMTTSIDLRRQALLTSATEAAQGVISGFDAEKESREIGSNVESAVALTAIAEAGAVGLGAIVTAAITTAALDVSGILLAGVIAVVGLFIIPYRRQQAKEKFKLKIEELRGRLRQVLSAQFGAEADRSITRLKEGVAPYTRFVRGEKDRLAKTGEQLDAARRDLSSLQERVEKTLV